MQAASAWLSRKLFLEGHLDDSSMSATHDASHLCRFPQWLVLHRVLVHIPTDTFLCIHYFTTVVRYFFFFGDSPLFKKNFFNYS